ncbi:hypothetical protein AB0B45_43780 [Nonomuraea sp. NPDC049152]|uniref:hypothetical protein n=1 Tax=Nonomuraea sp. NPDC049152 TaxID=3154350 RepID=UPI0034014EFB
MRLKLIGASRHLGEAMANSRDLRCKAPGSGEEMDYLLRYLRMASAMLRQLLAEHIPDDPSSLSASVGMYLDKALTYADVLCEKHADVMLTSIVKEDLQVSRSAVKEVETNVRQ